MYSHHKYFLIILVLIYLYHVLPFKNCMYIQKYITFLRYHSHFRKKKTFFTVNFVII